MKALKCKHCAGNCHKYGKQTNGKQKYRCKRCFKYQQEVYSSKAYQKSANKEILSLLKEGVGIRGMGRVLNISPTTVMNRIKQMAREVNKPKIRSQNGIYEVDELWTFYKSKKNELWITYIYDRNQRYVIDFVVGPRNKESINPLISGLLKSKPKLIATDGLILYRNMVPKDMHTRDPYQTLRIERNNLNLRTHLKRLSRKTINFSKNVFMLEASLKLYFWS